MRTHPEGGDGATGAQQPRDKQPRLETMHGGAPSAYFVHEPGLSDALASGAASGGHGINNKKEQAPQTLQKKLHDCGIMAGGVPHPIGHFLPHCLRPPDPDNGESGPPRPGQVSTPISAEFWKGKTYEITTQRATKQKVQVKQLVTLEGKDEGEHFEFFFQCRGFGKDSNPCRYKQNLMCKFCPTTQFPQLGCGSFQTWSNPVLCQTDYDVVRNAWNHVYGKNGWHMFWFAVHRLYQLHPGLTAAGAVPVTTDPHEIWLRECLGKNAHRLQANKEDFRRAGLLNPAGVGQEFEIAAKFERAEQALRDFNVSKNPPKEAKKRRTAEQSRSETPIKDEPEDTEESKRPRTSINFDRPEMPEAPAAFPARVDSDQFGPASMPLNPRETPGAAHHGQAFMALYNVNDTPIEEATMIADSFLNDPHSAGLPMHDESIMHDESMRTHRPIFNLLLDSLVGPEFGSTQHQEEWSLYDPASDFDIQNGDFQLARMVGKYMRSGLRSRNWDAFFLAAQKGELGPLCEPYRGVAGLPEYNAGACAFAATVYCYWHVERLLLDHKELLDNWKGVTRGKLVKIFNQMDLGNDEACEEMLVDFLFHMDRVIDSQLAQAVAAIREKCLPGGSFTNVVVAPRVWAFFAMLRLRHDADFSCALWKKGYRFVACDLDPQGVHADKEAWIAKVREAGVLPATGASGQGSVMAAGQAANPWADATPAEELLLCKLMAAEGQEVDKEAREADGEQTDLPSLSKRVSQTARRTALVFRGFPFVTSLLQMPLQEREYERLMDSLRTCRESEQEASALLDNETFAMIFATVARSKGAGASAGPPTRSAGRAITRGRGSRGSRDAEEDDEKRKAGEVMEDLHLFRDASGFWTSDWVLQVTVKQHEGNDDEEGERIAGDKVERGHDFRRYTVEAEQLIKVTLKNLSRTRSITVMPVYVSPEGEEEPQDQVEIKSAEEVEMNFPLQKPAGEDEDAWVLKDEAGKTVLRLCFVL